MRFSIANGAGPRPVHEPSRIHSARGAYGGGSCPSTPPGGTPCG